MKNRVAKGLIGFSGCLSGELCEELLAGNYEKARGVAEQYEDIFGKGWNAHHEVEMLQNNGFKRVHDSNSATSMRSKNEILQRRMALIRAKEESEELLKKQGQAADRRTVEDGTGCGDSRALGSG